MVVNTFTSNAGRNVGLIVSMSLGYVVGVGMGFKVKFSLVVVAIGFSKTCISGASSFLQQSHSHPGRGIFRCFS